MAEHDLDALLAIDLSRDEILLGNQRWLTGYIPIGGPAAALLHRGGDIELISERIGLPVTDYYKAHGFPIRLVNGFSSGLVAERVMRSSPKRLGIVESDSFPTAVAKALPPFLATVDVSDAFQRLRLQKTAYEIALIRESAARSPTPCGNVFQNFSGSVANSMRCLPTSTTWCAWRVRKAALIFFFRCRF